MTATVLNAAVLTAVTSLAKIRAASPFMTSIAMGLSLAIPPTEPARGFTLYLERSEMVGKKRQEGQKFAKSRLGKSRRLKKVDDLDPTTTLSGNCSL